MYMYTYTGTIRVTTTPVVPPTKTCERVVTLWMWQLRGKHNSCKCTVRNFEITLQINLLNPYKLHASIHFLPGGCGPPLA